jgi:hypothetical protein
MKIKKKCCFFSIGEAEIWLKEVKNKEGSVFNNKEIKK